MNYLNEQENLPDDPDQIDNNHEESDSFINTSDQNDSKLLNTEDDQSAFIDVSTVFDDATTTADSRNFLNDSFTALPPDTDSSILVTDSTDHLHHHGLHHHEHHDRISFAGYSSCYKCSCRGFTGNGQCCDNCGHNYHDHY
ncbi:MAG: hypothetical protein WCJ03_07165 [Bacteroidales bacterium]